MARRRQTENNTFEVKVARVGGALQTFLVEEGTTVEEVLEMADIPTGQYERIRVNGETADIEDVVESGDLVTLSGKIKGGTL